MIGDFVDIFVLRLHVQHVDGDLSFTQSLLWPIWTFTRVHGKAMSTISLVLRHLAYVISSFCRKVRMRSGLSGAPLIIGPILGNAATLDSFV